MAQAQGGSSRSVRQSSARRTSAQQAKLARRAAREEAEAAAIPEAFDFGEKAPGSLQIPFGDRDDPDEMSGGYWFLQCPEDEEQFRLVGGAISGGTQAEVQAMRDAVELAPTLHRQRLESIDIRFALELAGEAGRNNTASIMGDERPASPSEGADGAPTEELIVQIGDRLVDVIASLRQEFARYSGADGRVPISALRDLLLSLGLDVDDEEIREARLAFPEDAFTFMQFRNWWIEP